MCHVYVINEQVGVRKTEDVTHQLQLVELVEEGHVLRVNW